MNYIGFVLVLLFISFVIISLTNTIKIWQILLKYGNFFSLQSLRKISEEDSLRIRRHIKINIISFVFLAFAVFLTFLIGSRHPWLYANVF